MNFANLKKQSKDFSGLLKKVDELNKPTYERDDTTDNYWKPTPDKAGNALAVIRFLPGAAVDGDSALPWVQYWDHGFQSKSTGKWYIEKSLTTLGPKIKDPVSEYNSTLWNSTSDDNSPERKQARDQKRRLHYVSNIYVVSDPKNPQNEGKVFLFKYGKKIFDKLTKMMNPDLESEEAINPFCLWSGANFKLKMTRQSGFPNYDESTFLAPGPLTKDEAELEQIWKSEYSLNEIIDPKNFKTYEQLKARLDDVLGFTGSASTPRASAPVVDEDVPWKDEKPVAKKAPAPVVEDDEDDPDLAQFRKLIED
jgi:gp32 DNA binding protein like